MGRSKQHNIRNDGPHARNDARRIAPPLPPVPPPPVPHMWAVSRAVDLAIVVHVLDDSNLALMGE